MKTTIFKIKSKLPILSILIFCFGTANVLAQHPYSTWGKGDLNGSSVPNAAIGANTTAIGNAAGVNATAFEGVYIGHSSGANSNGLWNTFIGSYAGNLADGRRNMFLGYAAGNNMHGDNNVAIGPWALGGQNGGQFDTSGNSNFAAGYEAGRRNVGSFNYLFGLSAGYHNSGNKNMIFGYRAGFYISGNANILFGERAGYNVTGDNNIFMGSYAGHDAGGSDNIGIGKNTARYITGSDNVAIGNDAGNLLRGTRNVAIGYEAGPSSATSNWSDRLYIDSKETNFPLIWGNFANDELKIHGSLGVGANPSIINGAVAHFDGRVYVSEDDNNLHTGDSATEAGFDNTALQNYKDYLLWVEKGMVAEDVALVEIVEWPDYVFSDDYSLPSIQEMKAFINANGHLQNMPSAAEVEKNGFTITDMTKRTLKTVEELTLHTINQEEEITKLNEKLEKLMKVVEELTKK